MVESTFMAYVFSNRRQTRRRFPPTLPPTLPLLAGLSKAKARSAALSLRLPDSTAEWSGVAASGVLASFTFPPPPTPLNMPLSTDMLSSKSVSTTNVERMGVGRQITSNGVCKCMYICVCVCARRYLSQNEVESASDTWQA